MASGGDFVAIFSATPFQLVQPNGDQQVNGLLLPTYIPDGSPSHPGVTNIFALATFPMTVESVIVTNLNQHQNFGDLIGALIFNGTRPRFLNNHDGLGNTAFLLSIPLVYNDSANPTPGSRHTDGPGSLQSYQGKSGHRCPGDLTKWMTHREPEPAKSASSVS